MAKIEMMQMPAEEEDADCDDGDDTLADEEDRWAVKNQHSQLNCHFQMSYMHIYTPNESTTANNANRTTYVWEDMQQGDTHNAKQVGTSTS